MPADPLAFAPIAALRGGHESGAAGLLGRFARRRQAEGVRVAGVVAAPSAAAGDGDAGCECRGGLIELVSGARIEIHQDLGPGSVSCNLDSSALARACAAAEAAIAAGAGLVVLNRFGQQEASRGGLVAAFQAAVAAGVPLVCAVGPRVEAVWCDFADGLFTWLPAEEAALEAWWQAQPQGARQAA